MSPSSGGGLSARWLGPAGKIGFVVAALALAQVIGDQFPDPVDEVGEPHVRSAEVGESAELRALEIMVVDVRLGQTLQGPGSIASSPGVWVVPDVTYTPTTKDVGVALAQIVGSDGRVYRATRPLSANCGVSQPGLSKTCSVALELPVEALDGAVLQLASALDPRFDDLLEVDLGLTAADGQAAAGQTVSLVEQHFPILGEGR